MWVASGGCRAVTAVTRPSIRIGRPSEHDEDSLHHLHRRKNDDMSGPDPLDPFSSWLKHHFVPPCGLAARGFRPVSAGSPCLLH
jgi:hypothetical protein